MRDGTRNTLGPTVTDRSPEFFAAVANDYGTPVFIAWDEVFRTNCRRFLSEFRCGDRRCGAFYSYKTNNLKAFCSIAIEEGLGAEVVSPAELDMGLVLGLTGERIIYNGPLKTRDSLEQAIECGARIHVDSLRELQELALLAKDTGDAVTVGLRLAPSFSEDGSPVWSKFGLSLADGEVDEALRILAGSPALSCVGLHMHVGTNQTDPGVYERMAEDMANAFGLASQVLGYRPRYFDIGGGFSARSGAVPLMAHTEEWDPINVRNVVSNVEQSLVKSGVSSEVALLAEPGRVIAEPSMSLLLRVVSVKRRGERLQVILDGGTNVLPTAYYTRHPFYFPSSDSSETTVIADIHGPLCTQFDVLGMERQVPSLAPGDLVLIDGAGAYTYSFSAQFTGPRPPVVLVSGGTARLARMREPNGVLWQYDRLPDK